MANTHHDAAQRHERSGGEAKFLGPEQRGHGDIATGFQLAVRLDINAAAQIIQHERLVRFGEAEFPRAACVFDRGERRGARAAVMTADKHHVCVRLRDARSDRAHPDFRHQLHADARVAVGVLKVVNQLRQIFDGINIMMRRR